MRHLHAGRYLSALRQLRQLPADEASMAYNARMWAFNAVDPWGEECRFVGARQAPAPDPAALAEPLPQLVAAIQERRPVVLMEGHAFPETQFFGAEMVAALGASGATHLAFETFRQAPIAHFIRDGVMRPSTEGYGFAPGRAAVLRAARRVGMYIVAFDGPTRALRAAARAMAERGDHEALNRAREEWMAQNIVRRIFRRDRSARVVVWTGEQHAMKRTPTWWKPWQHPFMAAHLARLLGEEPYCVGQQCVNLPVLTAGPRLLTGDLPRLADCGLDAIVYHHRGGFPARPAWLDVRAGSVEAEPDGAALVQALPEHEGSTAVPVEQWLAPQDGGMLLRLRPGRYLLRGVDGRDRVLWERAVSVRETSAGGY